ncbi:MAG: EAL domain-containing protein [Lachnospiraceae bacterium]|nr:EAL domain-containing protein [Lachnospiraceae bacterium]
MQREDYTQRNMEVLNNLSDGKFIFVQDMRTGVTAWTKEAVEYLGLPGATMKDVATVVGALVHPDDYAKWKDEIDGVFAMEKKDCFCAYNIRNAKGIYVPCIQKGKMVLSDNGDPVIFTGSITIQKKDIELDAITDLPKHAQFIEDLRRMKKERGCLVMAVDIRRFTSVNSLYGYDFGSKTLYEIACFMKSVVGKMGRLYRSEGTEFLVLLDDCEVEDVNTIFARFRDGLAAFVVDGFTLNLDIFGGVLHTHNGSVSSQTVLSCVLSALEKAREEESYELVIFDDETQESHHKMMEMLDVIKASIRNNCEGFYLCYQPFVSTITGKIIGMEALVRFRNETYGEVSPGRFVPHLEYHTCFYDLSMWILRKALTDTKQLLETNPDFFINVNMSHAQMERETFKHEVVAILEELDFPKKNLQLELTERCRNMDLDYLREQLLFLRGHGIKVALDDFGTGSSTISLLCELPVTSVKIDQGFVLHILENTNNQVVVDSTVQCAKRLGLTVCMEGVETLEIKDFIGKYSANYHQGYYYSRPVDFERFKEILKQSWSVPEVSLMRGNPKETFGAESILSMMPGGFFIYANNETEKLLTVNETLLTIYECDTLDEFLDLTHGTFKGMVHPEDYERISKSIDEQIERNDSDMDFVQYRIITKHGTEKYVRDYGRLIRNDNDTDLYYVFLVEDYKQA